jgi:diacylglycerol kinase
VARLLVVQSEQMVRRHLLCPCLPRITSVVLVEEAVGQSLLLLVLVLPVVSMEAVALEAAVQQTALTLVLVVLVLVATYRSSHTSRS